MSASTTDLFRKASSGTRPEPTFLASQKAIAATSISLDAATGWQTDTGVDLIIYQTTTAGVAIPGTQTDWKGTLSGTTVSNMTLMAGTDRAYPAGEHSIVIATPTAAWGDSLIGGLLVSHDQTGALKSNVVGADQISTAAVTEDKLQSQAVTTAKIADDSVTPAKMLGIDLLGRTTAIAGSAPTAGTGQFYIQAGKTTGTFALNSLDITFPTPFPNGLLSVIITNGENATGGSLSVTDSNSTASGFRAQAGANGAGTVNWVAIGF